jgi:hypothetical protein
LEEPRPYLRNGQHIEPLTIRCQAFFLIFREPENIQPAEAVLVYGKSRAGGSFWESGREMRKSLAIQEIGQNRSIVRIPILAVDA